MAMRLRTARTATGPRQIMLDEETPTQRLFNWSKDAFDRPVSIGLPGMYFTPGEDELGRSRILQTAEPPKGASTFDPLMELTTTTGLRKILRGAVKMRAKRFKFTPEKLASELGQVDQLVEETPPGLAEWLRSFKLKSKIPGAQEGHGYYFPKKRQAYADPYSLKYEVGPLAAHEIHGHATQDIFRHRAPVGGALGKVQLKVDEAVVGIHQMRAQLDYMERLGAISGNLAKEHRAASIEKILEAADPGERIANSIETALGKGVNYRDAVKAAYREAKDYIPSDLRQLRNAAKQVEDMMLEAGEVFFQPF